MSSVIAALKTIFVAKQKFSKLESAIFSAVREQLTGDTLQLWDQQIAAINKIQRLPDGLEVDFYPMKVGKPNFAPEIAFQDRSEDFHLATVDVLATKVKAKLRARVWCVEGHLFMLKYLTSYKDFERIAQSEWQVYCHIENYPN
jgi:hypothetical protein